MVGCSAPFCSNSSEKGFFMKRFPSDVERRKRWALKVRRADEHNPKKLWIPSDVQTCCLCEVHFDETQWLDKKTGKLKKTAVPTIFKHAPIREPTKRKQDEGQNGVNDFLPPAKTPSIEIKWSKDEVIARLQNELKASEKEISELKKLNTKLQNQVHQSRLKIEAQRKLAWAKSTLLHKETKDCSDGTVQTAMGLRFICVTKENQHPL